MASASAAPPADTKEAPPTAGEAKDTTPIRDRLPEDLLGLARVHDHRHPGPVHGQVVEEVGAFLGQVGGQAVVEPGRQRCRAREVVEQPGGHEMVRGVGDQAPREEHEGGLDHDLVGTVAVEAVEGVAGALAVLVEIVGVHDLGIDVLKLDRSFMTRAVATDQGWDIVETLVSLGRSLGIRVIAEGVETREQLGMLRSWGSQECQGFLFSPAVPAGEFLARFG